MILASTSCLAPSANVLTPYNRVFSTFEPAFVSTDLIIGVGLFWITRSIAPLTPNRLC
uniref:Uncharacterized protein n=1 Tax=uncultured marine virus TaxID=186617 RepID=A0A0F7L4F8_9VIRU|nr:hypothetical protein [uncultured marine virus]